MPADNVETMRRYVELLNETRQMPVELLQPDVEMHMFRGSPIPGPYHGYDGVRRWREDTFDVFEDWRMELDEVVAGPDSDVVVAVHRFVGRMRHTELPSNFPLFVVVRFRDGLIARFEGFRDRGEALQAAGIPSG